MKFASEDTKIFISYRRGDGGLAARFLYNELIRGGYEHIFYDFNSIREGDFRENIVKAINACSDFLLIVSPQALDRCHEKGDWLTFEIENAKQQNKNIIPVVFDCLGQLQWPLTLPEELKFLTTQHAHTVHINEMYDESMHRLRERIKAPRLTMDRAVEINKVLNSTFTKIELRVEPVKLPKIQDAVERWGKECADVAFNDIGRGVAINRRKDFVVQGDVEPRLIEALEKAKNNSGIKIRDIILTDHYWCIAVTLRGELRILGEVPIKIKALLKGIIDRGEEDVLSISFNDFGEYVIVTNKEIYCSKEEIYACIRFLQKEYNCQVWSVDLSNSSFIVNGTNQCRPASNFNRKIGFAIQQCGYFPRRVKFTDAGLYYISAPGRIPLWYL